MEFPQHLVTAVLVAHDGAVWLPEVLAALQWQRRGPQRVVAVDTGSTDDTRAILDRELGTESVLTAEPTTGFGAAVGIALAAYAGAPDPVIPGRGEDGDTVEWIWLLHDDCAPAPDALRNLLELADRSPSAAVIGPKVHSWHEPGVIVEVGFTVDTSGRRETGLEQFEIDQGQHDSAGDVLAVGTAGALVRKDVWDALGGFDPALPLFRDDLDFCWRVHLAGHRVVVAPRAVIRHVGAAWTKHRTLRATPNRPRRVDRAHALYTLLVDLSAVGLLFTVLRLVFGSAFRALGLVLAKRLADAADEIVALGMVLGHPRRIIGARRRRAVTRELPHRAVRPLLAKRSTRLRHYADSAANWLAERARSDSPRRGARPASALETGPSSADDDFEQGGDALLRRLLIRPGPLLVLALVVVTLVAERALLGSGDLAGGRLLPVDGGARDLWSSFFASWHPVAEGSDTTAPPYFAPLALLATLLFGKAWFAVDVLLLGCVPLAGLTAYYAAGRVTRDRLLRVWAASTYALLPVAGGVVAAGRLGDAVAFITIPLLLVAGARVLRSDPRFDGWRHVWSTGLLLAVAVAFAPVLYLVALPVLVGSTVAVRLTATPTTKGGAARRTLAAALVAALPLVLLWPWTERVISDPGLILNTPAPNIPGLTADQLHPSALLLAAPGGPGTPPIWLTVPLLAAALAGLLRLARRGLARSAWGLAIVALVVGILVARAHTVPTTGDGRVVGWPGVPTAVLGAGLLVAALVAAEGARARLRRMSFSWRQPLAALVVVSAAVVPLMTGAAWLARGADDPVDRVHGSAVPAFVAAEAAAGERPRVLAIRAQRDGSLTYSLLRDGSLHLGDADLLPARDRSGRVDTLVGELAAGRGGDAVAALSTYGVQYVLLPEPSDPRTAAVLDATAGLSRVSTANSVDLWKLDAPAGRVVVLSGALAKQARTRAAPTAAALQADPPTPIPSGDVGMQADLPESPTGGLLVLAETRDDGWRAEVDGRRLESVRAWGWAQGFVLPSTGGRLRIWHDAGGRHAELAVEGVIVVLILVLAWPTLSRRAEGPGGHRPARRADPVGRRDAETARVTVTGSAR